MSDAETLKVYATKATEYRDLTQDTPQADPLIAAFLAALPAASAVLDLGCGPGHFAARFAEAGHTVTATDASPEMVALADAHPDVTAQIGTFDDISGTAIYDGVWANFSLLHAPRADMPRHLTALQSALKPGGMLHIGLKSGTGDQRDPLGRLYTYYTDAELTGLLVDAGFTVVDRATGADKGLDGVVAPWIALRAHA